MCTAWEKFAAIKTLFKLIFSCNYGIFLSALDAFHDDDIYCFITIFVRSKLMVFL